MIKEKTKRRKECTHDDKRSNGGKGRNKHWKAINPLSITWQLESLECEVSFSYLILFLLFSHSFISLQIMGKEIHEKPR